MHVQPTSLARSLAVCKLVKNPRLLSLSLFSRPGQSWPCTDLRHVFSSLFPLGEKVIFPHFSYLADYFKRLHPLSREEVLSAAGFFFFFSFWSWGMMGFEANAGDPRYANASGPDRLWRKRVPQWMVVSRRERKLVCVSVHVCEKTF